MQKVSALILALAGTATVAFAQPTRVKELLVTGGGSSLSIVPPAGITQPVVFDLSGLASCLNPNSPGTTQLATFTTRVVDGKIVFAVQKAEAMAQMAPSTSETMAMMGVQKDARNTSVCEGTVTIPVMKEYETFTAHVPCEYAVPGKVVVATPLQHLPDGFVISYSTCIERGTIDIRLVNLAGVCTQPLPISFAIAVIDR